MAKARVGTIPADLRWALGLGGLGAIGLALRGWLQPLLRNLRELLPGAHPGETG